MAAFQRRQLALRHPAPPAEVEALRAACPPGEVPDADVPLARTLATDPVAYPAALAR